MSYILVTPSDKVYRGTLAELRALGIPDGELYQSRVPYPHYKLPDKPIVVDPFGRYINTETQADAELIAELYSDDGIDHRVYIRAPYPKELA